MKTFEPINGGLDPAFWVALMITIVALGALFWLMRVWEPEGRTRAYRPLAQLLVFIVILLAGGTALFTGWTSLKLIPVTVSEESVVTSYGEAKFANIRQIYMHKDQEKSLVNPALTVRTTMMLIIEEKDGKTHILSEAHYELGPILKAIDEQRKRQEKTE
jgi:hypothetical protein